MRTFFNFVSLLLMLTMNASCRMRDNIRKEMKEFYNSHIELPIDSMLNLSTKSQRGSYKYAKYIYIVYVDSTSCTDCAISHLSDWSQLNIMDAFKKGELKYMFVVAPKQEQRAHVLNIIEKDTLFNEFVYVDTTGIFERRNPKIPTNKLLHSFLVNKKRDVELIGNPISNTDIKNMLVKIMLNKDL